MIKAIFMMCSQGIIEIYSKNYPLEKQELTSVTNLSRVPKYGIEILYEEHNVSFYAESWASRSLISRHPSKSDWRDSSKRSSRKQ